MRSVLVLFVCACLAPTPLIAQANPVEATLALGGLDPVALCGGQERQGSAELVASYGRFQYRFVDAASRKKFTADPERWAIQWDGACARMGPLSGTGTADRWFVYDDRIYIFASDGCRDAFKRRPDNYVPGTPDVFPAPPTAAELERGRQWIAKAVAAHGGATAVDAGRALRLSGHSSQEGWRHQRQLVITRDGAVRRQSSWKPPAGDDKAKPLDTVWVLAEPAFTVENGKVFDIFSPAGRADLRRFATREPVALLWARHAKGFRACYRGESQRDGELLVDIDVDCWGLRTHLHLDPKSGLIRRISWRGRPGEGATQDIEEKLTGWRLVRGVQTPDGREVEVGGRLRKNMSIGWSSLELLPAVPGLAFDRPRPGIADRAAVRRAVQDYVEALYLVKPGLIERSVHPALEKFGSWRPEDSRDYRIPAKMTYEQLVDLAGRWNKDAKQGPGLKYEIEILDLLDVTAAAKLTAKWGVDYMQLTKRQGRWKIIHVLWQSHPPK